MNKKCSKCGMMLPDYLTMELADKNGSMAYCPNCITEAAYNDELSFVADDNLICDITGKPGAVRFVCEGETYTLNPDSMVRLVRHTLNPDEYFALTKKYSAANYMLHDDFYDEATGEAIMLML